MKITKVLTIGLTSNTDMDIHWAASVRHNLPSDHASNRIDELCLTRKRFSMPSTFDNMARTNTRASREYNINSRLWTDIVACGETNIRWLLAVLKYHIIDNRRSNDDIEILEYKVKQTHTEINKVQAQARKQSLTIQKRGRLALDSKAISSADFVLYSRRRPKYEIYVSTNREMKFNRKRKRLHLQQVCVKQPALCSYAGRLYRQIFDLAGHAWLSLRASSTMSCCVVRESEIPNYLLVLIPRL